MLSDSLYDLSQRLFPMHLRRMCILLLLNGIYVCLLGSFGLIYSSSLMFSYWFSIRMIHPLLKMGHKVPTIIVLLSITLFSSSSICLIYLSVPILYAYTFTTIISSQWINTLSLYNDLLCVLLYFWLKRLFCLVYVYLPLLSFGFHLQGISFTIPSF